MVVKVYGPSCASTKRVLVCLVEKEIEFEDIPVDIFKVEQKNPEFLKWMFHGIKNVKMNNNITKFHRQCASINIYLGSGCFHKWPA